MVSGDGFPPSATEVVRLGRVQARIGLPWRARYPCLMDEIDKRVRRSALKLIASSLALGFMIGLAVGAAIVYYSIDRVVVIPLEPGVKV